MPSIVVASVPVALNLLLKMSIVSLNPDGLLVSFVPFWQPVSAGAGCHRVALFDTVEFGSRHHALGAVQNVDPVVGVVRELTCSIEFILHFRPWIQALEVL